jgi:membrane protease YdiL (CAAX protease family)
MGRSRVLGRGHGVDRDVRVIVAYIALIAVAEVCIAFVSPLAGTVVYALLVLAMLTHSTARLAPQRSGSWRRDVAAVESRRLDLTNAITALALLPILRLVSLTAPVGAGTQAGQYLLVGGVLLTAIAWAAWSLPLPTASLRPRFPALQVGVVWLGVPLVLAAYFAIRPDSVADGTSWTHLAAAALAVCLVAVVEELIFRGFIQTAFARLYGPIAAPLCATAVYLILYLGARPWSMVIYAAVIGLLFGWLVQRTQSLVGVTVSHSVVNVGFFVFLPLAASHT